MHEDHDSSRALELREGNLWLGTSKITTLLPSPIPAAVLAQIEGDPDPTYDICHLVSSTERYISSQDLLMVATNGAALTDDQVGSLIATVIGTLHALEHLLQAVETPNKVLVDHAMAHARYVLKLPWPLPISFRK